MARNFSTDTLSKSGAEALARGIRLFWAGRGYEVKTWVEMFEGPGRKRTPEADRDRADTFFAVRSDMVGGLPARHMQSAAA